MPIIQSFNAALLEKRYLTKDVLLLTFSVPESFAFQAGQFVTFILKHQEQSKARSYSILNPPSEKGKINLCIKVLDSGFASNIFQKSKLGDQFLVKGPFGHFLFDSQSKEHWFIGAGTGVAPLYSLIKEHLPKHPEMKFKLVLGFRNLSSVLFFSEIKELENAFPNFNFLLTLSQEASDGPRGRVQQHLGNDLQEKTFYICGLKDLVLETRKYLLERGVAPEKIRFERYD